MKWIQYVVTVDLVGFQQLSIMFSTLFYMTYYAWYSYFTQQGTATNTEMIYGIYVYKIVRVCMHFCFALSIPARSYFTI